MKTTHLIIGAGPAGLGAGWRLKELGVNDFLILERSAHVGGLAASFKDNAGFTWDVGGHVVFSHYEYFDRLLDSLLGGEYLEHQREAWIRLAGTWIPYPFQNNIRHLPPRERWRCVQGLLRAREAEASGRPAHFREWIGRVFGEGVAELFMLPYNWKVWATRPERMDFGWIGERVSVVDLERVLKNLVLELDDVSWGPNNTFRFPLYGGTGEIFRRLGRRLSDHILIGQEMVRLDPVAKTATVRGGEAIEYETLLNTGPLDRLVLDQIVSPPDAAVRAAGELTHNGVWIGGVGVRGHVPDSKCWMYFPESNCPFYRVTNFHNYSPKNVPHQDRDGRYRSFMAEVSFSRDKAEDLDGLMDRTVDGLVAAGLMAGADREQVASRWERRVDYGYPVPCLARDRALRTLQPWLESQGVYSRGRFGGWKYEVGNMDHSVMQGVEWADFMVRGQAEKTYSA